MAQYDLGAVVVIGGLLIAPAGIAQLRSFRLRHAVLLWALGWLVGIASFFERRRS